jgi:hypothetical protein
LEGAASEGAALVQVELELAVVAQEVALEPGPKTKSKPLNRLWGQYLM